MNRDLHDAIDKIRTPGGLLGGIRDGVRQLETEIADLRRTNAELSEHLQSKWGRDPYLGHIQTENSRLRKWIDYIRSLAENPTDGHQTRCIEIVVACNRSLHMDAWPEQ